MEVDIAPQFGAELKVYRCRIPDRTAATFTDTANLQDGFKNVNAWVCAPNPPNAPHTATSETPPFAGDATFPPLSMFAC